MKLGKPRQHFVRRLTWTLGIALLPFACYGLVIPRLQVRRPGPSGPVVEKFTKAIQVADWQTASSCYVVAPEIKTKLLSELDFPRPGLLKGIQFYQSANYYLPFSGEHDIYKYRLFREHHNMWLVVDCVITGDT